MANTYLDQTGIIHLDKVTPIIQALFGAYKLDPTTPGNGDAYIGSSSQGADLSWNSVAECLKDVATSLGIEQFNADWEPMPAVLASLAKHFGCADDPYIVALTEEWDWDDDAGLPVLFELAQRFDDGHGLQYLQMQGAWTCNRPLLGQFGGYAEFSSKQYFICEDTKSIAELGLEVHKALINSEYDRAADLIGDQVVEALLEGIQNEDTRRTVRLQVAAKLAVLPAKPTSARQFAEQQGHTNSDACTTILKTMFNGTGYDFRICGAGKDAYFEWINELGIPVCDVLDEIESPEAAKQTFLAWLAA